MISHLRRPKGTRNLSLSWESVAIPYGDALDGMTRRIGVVKAALMTVHAYTLPRKAWSDAPASNMRRGRAGAAKATNKALPELEGHFDGMAIRVPVPVGSIADTTFVTERATTVEEVSAIFREEADSNLYRGTLGVAEEPIVSSDIIGDPHASVVDLQSTQVVDGNL